MYERYFGLTSRPFSLLPEPNFLFPSARHQRIVNLLEYGMETEAGFIVITGDVGAGKTTIIRHVLSHLPANVTVGLITNPSKRLGSMLSWVSNAFELQNFDHDEARMYNGFVEFLLAQYAKGKRTTLIIDEAQNLTADVLEELRMLSNVNNEQDQLLQIILAGQPELLDTLNKPELRQFVQRISVHGHLNALSPVETLAYIRHRLFVAGGASEIINVQAAAAVHFFSRGVPRLINLLCDQSLMYVYAEDEKVLTASVVAEVAQDRNQGGLSPFTKLDPKGDGLEVLLKPIVAEIMQEIKSIPDLYNSAA